ncbi:hypothetical protein [Halobacillus andaensis]|uniref:hypothetical protein n=1 Tax=Halobacillus andaensis TaxID=1176239 RepID=UPI003D707FF9
MTLLIVRSSDERINSIEAGRESNRKVKEVEEGDVVVFSWDESVPFDVMNAVAYDEQEEALFYYGFPEDEANLDASDVGWHEQ